MNVVLMLADQLRADCVGCCGNRTVRTPHIDQLAAEGTRFTQAFAQHPQCVPSRAVILTGRYPHVNGAISNHATMAENEVTLGEYFRAAGFRSIGIGKLHIFEAKEKAGFTDTMLCGGQHSGAISPDCLREDYKQWLKENGFWEDAEKAYAAHDTPEYWENFQAATNPMPAEAYIDSWVGDRAVEYIRNQPETEPFFMFVGFPNPHIPFDAPEPYASMYDPDEVPVPATFGLDLNEKPPHQIGYKRHGRKMNYEDLDEKRLRRVISLYYASITLVDDQVGKIMTALRDRDMLDNTLVVFLSDHGELLGHYGMLIKSIDEYPMLYDVGLHVPFVVRKPGAPAGNVVDTPVELIDVCPTLLESAGLPVAPEIQGFSLVPALLGGTPPEREYIFAETGAVKSIRGARFKLVYYPGQDYGELYDIVTDPLETKNLYDDPGFSENRASMIRDMLDLLIDMEAPRHGESKRGPAYWRKLYRMPFD